MTPDGPFRLLVVTDNESVRHELEFGFPADVEVTLAREARDAWEWLREEVPSAVVVDLQTGSSGGFSLASDMSASARLAGVPVVMLVDRYQDDWLARRCGARAVLVKPVDAGAVLAAVTGAPAA